MKTIALIASILAIAAMVAAETKEEKIGRMKSVHEECQADPATKVDENVMEKFFKGEPVDEVQFAKHSACMNKKTGLQKADGDVDKDELKKTLGNHEKVDEIVEECGQRKGDAEETALAVLKCLRKYLPKPAPGHEHHGH